MSAHEPLDITIRPAQTADLPRVGEIWAANQGDRTAAGVPSLYEHELAHQELVVAERGGVLLGFASLVARGSVAFLADLFVDPACQSNGVGRQLLQHVLPVDGRLCCTISSGDPRALALYIRAGLRPYWPCYQLRARLQDLHDLDTGDMESVETVTDDPELVRWDQLIGGRLRPQDHAYWVQRRGAVPMWFALDHRRVGYGYAQTHSDDLVREPETVTLGPIGARQTVHAAKCVTAAVRWARSRAERARIFVPAAHPALAHLLEMGFRIVDSDTFCSTRPPVFTDVRRYLPSGEDLF